MIDLSSHPAAVRHEPMMRGEHAELTSITRGFGVDAFELSA